MLENTICNIAQITFTDVYYYYSHHNKAGRVRNITDNDKKRQKNLDKYQDIRISGYQSCK